MRAAMRFALRSIVLDYVLESQKNDKPTEFIDLLTDEKVTLDEVLTFVMEGEVV